MSDPSAAAVNAARALWNRDGTVIQDATAEARWVNDAATVIDREFQGYKTLAVLLREAISEVGQLELPTAEWWRRLRDALQKVGES